MFAGIEVDEMARRERRSTPPAGEFALFRDHVAVETDVLARSDPESGVFALDDPPFFGRIEDGTGAVRVGRHGFESVERRGEVNITLFELREEFDPAFDRVVAHEGVLWSPILNVVRADRKGHFARPQGACVSRSRQVIGVAVLATAVAIATIMISPDAVFAWIESLRSRPVAFAAVVICLFCLRPVVLWPLSLCSAVVGYGYGLVGFPVALVGVCLSCLPAYALGRYADGGSGIVERFGRAGGRFFERTGGIRGVAVARLVPLPADAVSCGAGLSGVTLRAYLVGTALGETPWTLAAVLAGHSLSRLAVEGLDGMGIEFGAAVTAVALVALAGPAYEYVRERRAHQNVSEQS